MQTTTSHPTASELEADWRAIGFVHGAPVSMPPALVAADVRIYRALRCADCGHRGHVVKAFHRQREYRLLCRCRSCGAGSEA
jgi:hypothetical protein